MRFFQLNRKYLAVIGIEPLQPFQKKQPLSVFVRRFVVFISIIVYAILSLVFLGYEAKTLNEYADSFYGFASMIGCSIILATMLWKMNILFKLIGDFEKLIEKRMENPQSKQIYVKLNENFEKWTGVIYFFMVQVTVPVVMMPKLFISFYLYFATDLGNEAFSLPFVIWAPFDWKTPIGYLIIFTIECSAGFFVCHFCACYIATFTLSCYIIFTLCDGMNDDIHALDESSKAGENSAELMKRVGDIVEFHAAAKQLRDKFDRIIVEQLVFDMDNFFALTTITYFVWSLASICSTLLVVQMDLEQNVNAIELIKPVFMAFWSLARLFLICEFGQMLTDHFDQLTDAINDCDWTLFPKEIQKILPIIIQNTQREVVLETFKNASCSRESFKKVVNKGFSYFMVFRKFR